MHLLFVFGTYLLSTIKHTTTYLGDNPHVGLVGWASTTVIGEITSSFHFQLLQEISLVIGIIIGVSTIYGFLKKEGLFLFILDCVLLIVFQHLL